MTFKDLINNYNEYKKGIKTRERMLKVINKINKTRNDILYFLTFISIIFGIPFLISSILSMFISEEINFFIMSFFLMFPFINKILDYISKLTCGSMKNCNLLLKSFLEEKIIMSKSTRNKMNKSFNNISKKINLNFAIEIENLIKEIRNEEIRKYKERHPFTPSFLNEVHAKEEIFESEMNIKKITDYLLHLSNPKELKELNQEKLKKFLKEFDIEEQIEITTKIRKILEEEEVKNEILNENLKKIKNFQELETLNFSTLKINKKN